MQFSEHWLRDWVNPSVDSKDLVEKFTMAGLEVDSIAPVAGEFSKIFVAEVLSTEPHPEADKLTLCQVSIGEPEPLQIVCGAPNVKKGLKVPCAVVGAVLPGNFKIKKAKLRGQESFGMLCSEEELGLADSADGLMELPLNATVGEDIRKYLNLDDQVIDVDLTPNRGDCLSIRGLARELGVLTREEVRAPIITQANIVHNDTFPVVVSASEACPRYVGRVIKNIDNHVQTPLWLVERLRRSGLRSLDPVVDVTNYVLLELGQPMHAFDLDKLSGAINVRLAESGEMISLIDGQEVKLNLGTPLISDKKGPLAIAGVMGGSRSAVSRSTKAVFLESAFFNPVSIAGEARKYGLHTDSSHRFERGVDYELQQQAIERATQLLLEIIGGEAGPLTEVVSPELIPEQSKIVLRSERIARLLGFEMKASEIEDILGRLGLDFVKQAEGVWLVKTLSYRFDIQIEEDLIEELGRVYGYSLFPSRMPEAGFCPLTQREVEISSMATKRLMVEQDYQEVITYSFVDPAIQSLMAFKENKPLTLLNPISSDLSEMRVSLWPGLIKALQYNYKRQHERIRLFELGTCFLPKESGLEEQQRVAGIICGKQHQENWTGQMDSVDFFDVKGDVENLLELTGQLTDYQFSRGNHPALHPGQSATVVKNGLEIGNLGALHPKLAKSLQFDGPIYLFELQLSQLTRSGLPYYSQISRFPGVRRDVALLLSENVLSAEVLSTIRCQQNELLKDVRIFDVYAGKGIKEGLKSIALSLFFQHAERTLDEEEVTSAIEMFLEKLKTEFNAILRE